MLREDYKLKHQREKEFKDKVNMKSKAKNYSWIVREMQQREMASQEESWQDPIRWSNDMHFKNYTNERFNMEDPEPNFDFNYQPPGQSSHEI